MPDSSRGARAAAGALAALGVVLLRDPFTDWVRQFAGGLSEPLLVALVLGAVERELARRRGQAFALGVAASLLRPEAWPFLAVYGAYLWRGRVLDRKALIAGGLVIPLAWLVPDLIASGDALTGAGRARSATGSPPAEAMESLGRSLDLVLWALWITAAWVAWRAWRRREPARFAVAALAAGWIVVVAAMAALGYAGLPRFAAPAGALVCVLGAIGLVELIEAVGRARRVAGRLRAVGLGVLIRGPRYRRAIGAAVVVGAVIAGLTIQGAIRSAELPGVVDDAVAFEDRVTELDELVDRAGPELERCGPVAIADLLFQTNLAWELDRPMAEVGVRFDSLPPRGTMIVGRGPQAVLKMVRRTRAERVAASGVWSAYAVACGRPVVR
jgi:hypothetical protein